MKISAFHIKNYRSIVDSSKRFLSPDNITAIIGQNESGKTSILEALKSFYEGNITDDVLRSDLSFPEIQCTFQLEENENLSTYLNMHHIPVVLHECLNSKRDISISRIWTNSRKSTITIADNEIRAFYDSREELQKETEKKIFKVLQEKKTEFTSADLEFQDLEREIAGIRHELSHSSQKVEELNRFISRSKKQEDLTEAHRELEELKKQYEAKEEVLKNKLSLLDAKRLLINSINEIIKVCQSFYDVSGRVEILTGECNAKSDLIRNTELQMELSLSEKESRLIQKQLDQLRSSQQILNQDLKTQLESLSIKRKIAGKMLDGKKSTEAEGEAWKEYQSERDYLTTEDIGKQVFIHIPVFEFFEDFSSLLPNKIDLEDLLNENTHAEGYKAARNFLSVAGLNAEFFREQNHRILKQKIENLNTDITIDFQDYWRQNLGNRDKIRMHFELEHYDYTQPDKSGKPYLEFWIKDKQERLYPKQRSRGVRWFLSFYLELKATAKRNTRNRVILIDEPGLSLHARAQEDVLKVFEDLREKLQIIYCTHSPNLIDLQKLYRIIAVQRARDNDERSETLILDAQSLHEASSDTLSPIYALMGTKLNDKQFIFPKNNIVVDDVITFYYLDTMAGLMNVRDDMHFIPSSGAENIPVIVNLLFGWKIDFGVFTFDNSLSQVMVEMIRSNMFFRNDEMSGKKIRTLKGFASIEDLFSTIDFKKFVLQQRTGITVSNSEYINSSQLSRNILASGFCSKIQNEAITFEAFDEETRSNFQRLFDLLIGMIE